MTKSLKKAQSYLCAFLLSMNESLIYCQIRVILGTMLDIIYK